MATAEVRIYDRDGTTLRATLAGKGLAASHRKGVDASDLQLTGKVIEAAIGNDPELLDDALARVYLDTGEGMLPWGCPYVLSPGGGTVIGSDEDASHEFQPVGKGALMLFAEMLVLHYGGEVNRRGPRDVSFGWQHPEYGGAGFYAPDIVTRASLDSGDAKHNNPPNWPANLSAASWIYDETPQGSLTLFRGPEFNVPAARKYYFMASADEEYKVYLHGPGHGGQVIEEFAQEDGYLTARIWSEVLQPGDYRVTAEMTTVGLGLGLGDGFDAFTCGAFYLDQDPFTFSFTEEVPVVVTNSTWRLLRQSKNDPRPGLTVGHMLRIMLAENVTWGVESASLFTPTFTDTVDSAGQAWPAGVERTWPVGTTLAQVLSDLSDEVDFDVDSDFNFHAYSQRGGSTGVVMKAGAMPATAGMSIVELTYQSEPVTATRAVVLTEDGFVEVIDDTIEATVASRGTYLESSQSASTSEGRRLGQRFIDANAVVRSVFTAKTIGVDGNVPGRDFSWGDTITGLDRSKANITARVLGVSLEQGDDPPVFFTTEYQEA